MGTLLGTATSTSTTSESTPTLTYTLLWNAASTETNKYEPNPRPTTGFYRYVGPTDPATLGVTLRTGDEWIATSAVVAENPLTMAALSAATTFSSTSFSDVAGLSLPVKSGVKYYFEVDINFSVADTTNGTKWALNGPTFSDFNMRGITSQAIATLANTFTGSYDVGSVTPASLASGNTAMMFGTIIPSADGNLQVRGGTELASSVVTVHTGSMMRLTRLP